MFCGFGASWRTTELPEPVESLLMDFAVLTRLGFRQPESLTAAEHGDEAKRFPPQTTDWNSSSMILDKKLCFQIFNFDCCCSTSV